MASARSGSRPTRTAPTSLGAAGVSGLPINRPALAAGLGCTSIAFGLRPLPKTKFGRMPMVARLTGVFAAAVVLAAASQMASRAAPTLDYNFFKSRVEPVFLQKRDGHTRCYVCHAEANNGFRLERLSPGASAWDEEQSRKNFEMASKLVNPGDPDTSRLLQQPLAPEAGGNIYHSGGRQFASKDDPNYKTLVDGINGKKL